MHLMHAHMSSHLVQAEHARVTVMCLPCVRSRAVAARVGTSASHAAAAADAAADAACAHLCVRCAGLWSFRWDAFSSFTGGSMTHGAHACCRVRLQPRFSKWHRMCGLHET
eukprot:jgi/Ulvmu1/892/UM100_0048.1